MNLYERYKNYPYDKLLSIGNKLHKNTKLSNTSPYGASWDSVIAISSTVTLTGVKLTDMSCTAVVQSAVAGHFVRIRTLCKD